MNSELRYYLEFQKEYGIDPKWIINTVDDNFITYILGQQPRYLFFCRICKEKIEMSYDEWIKTRNIYDKHKIKSIKHKEIEALK